MNIPVNVRMALLSLLLTSAACIDVTTNRNDSRQDCKKLLCDIRKSYKSIRQIQCMKNVSDITIWFKENEGGKDYVYV